MGMNDFQIGLTAGLDGTKSKQQLNNDIDALKKQLNNVEVQAKLGKDVVSNITKQLNTTQISLQNVNIDQSAINKMVSQINNALSNININLGQNIGGSIQGQVQNSVSHSMQIIDIFRQSLSNIGMGTGEIDTVIRRINSLGVEIDSLNQSLSHRSGASGDRNILSVDVSGVDKLGQAVKLTEQYDVDTGALIKSLDAVSTAQQKVNSNVDTFVDKQKKAVTQAENTLNTIKSKLSDQGETRTLANLTDSEKQANGLTSAITKAESAITGLKNATKGTFTDANNEFSTAITELNNLITKLKNAEYAATSLRTKDIGTIKIDEDNKLDTFVEKMKQSGHYTTELENNVSSLKRDLNNVFDTNSLTNYLNGVSNLESEFKKVDAQSKTLEKTTKLQVNIDSEKKQLQVYTNELKEAGVLSGDVKDKIQSMFASLSKVDSQNGLTTWRAELKGVKAEADEVLKSVKNLSSTNISVSDIKTSISDLGSTTTAITTLQNNFAKLGLTSEEVTGRMSSVSSELTKLNKLMDSKASDDEIVKQFNKLNVALSQTQNDLRQTRSEISTTNVIQRQFATETSRLSKAESWQKWADNNTKAMKKYGDEIDSIIKKIRNLDEKMTNEESKSLTNRMDTLKGKARDEGLLGKTGIDKLKTAWEKFGGWSLATGSLMKGVNEVKEAVTELKDLNDILTEISKTSDLTNNQIKELGSASFDTASKYGKTASDYLTGVQEMYRAGFDNAENMSELSILAQSAGDMDTNNANDYLIATNAAYDYKGSVQELNKVLDSQNYITNNAAVSMQDMADATSEAASIAAQYGVKVDELSSLIAVAVSKTRESGSEVGTALKALLINLQNTTSDPIKKAFEDVGISMTKIVGDSEQLKTPIELLKELSVAYNKLPEGDTKKANILNKIGGKHHANTLAAILSDQDAYNSMMDLYNSSSAVGSAQQEADKSANNWSGTMNKISNSWTELVSKFAESDSIITVLNLVNDLTQGLGNLADVLNTISSIGGNISSLGGNIGVLTGLITSLTGHGEKSIMYCAHRYKIINNVA